MDKEIWKHWVKSREIQESLPIAQDMLKVAWRYDQMHPKSYPLNTVYALAQIVAGLSTERPPKRRRTRLLVAKAPKTLAELIPEASVRHAWEDQHSGTFDDAVRVAGSFDTSEKERDKTLKGILNAMETAFWVSRYGYDILSRPKINILHKGLKRIAKVAGLEKNHHAAFFNYMCPCGLGDHKEAVRKLEGRVRRFAAKARPAGNKQNTV